MNNFKKHAHALILMIDEILKEKGKSRYWLSKQTGISQGQLSQYFNLDVTPGLDVYLKLLHTLDVIIFFEDKENDTDLAKLFNQAMDALGRRNNKLRNN
ncbi:helix-turn-helix domain-containing protein [Flavobacteriaceae bacterium Ap0902]|nr:helix-turn-helix domain-containing protein [Flavobacteriaceae bacterium Ap0902]